jgi:hypothetical protein
MSSSPLGLKKSRSWFAAGIEVQQALEILTDGAFKVFIYICLNAERESGILHTTQKELARNLRKSNGATRKYLTEMETAGICHNRFGHNPVTRGAVQISPAYWPYERNMVQPPADEGADKFVAEIRKMLAAHACVRSSFATVDEVLARQWFKAAVPLERIRQAILLGCARKYISWRNNQAVHGPISALRYFEPILEEIQRQKFDADYWNYLRIRIKRHERLWIEKHRVKTEMQIDKNVGASALTVD